MWHRWFKRNNRALRGINDELRGINGVLRWINGTLSRINHVLRGINLALHHLSFWAAVRTHPPMTCLLDFWAQPFVLTRPYPVIWVYTADRFLLVPSPCSVEVVRVPTANPEWNSLSFPWFFPVEEMNSAAFTRTLRTPKRPRIPKKHLKMGPLRVILRHFKGYPILYL